VLLAALVALVALRPLVGGVGGSRMQVRPGCCMIAEIHASGFTFAVAAAYRASCAAAARRYVRARVAALL
jgi:hypothetical protein